MRKFLMTIPAWVMSATLTLMVVYLSLGKNPLPFDDSLLFKHFDKVAHVLMYFALTCVYLYDYTKSIIPHHTKLNKELALTTCAAIVGLLLEIAQLALCNGRSFELADWFADLAGVVLGFFFMHFVMIRRIRHYLNYRRHHHHRHKHQQKGYSFLILSILFCIVFVVILCMFAGVFFNVIFNIIELVSR